jgi:hypothetical protein
MSNTTFIPIPVRSVSGDQMVRRMTTRLNEDVEQLNQFSSGWDGEWFVNRPSNTYTQFRFPDLHKSYFQPVVLSGSPRFKFGNFLQTRFRQFCVTYKINPIHLWNVYKTRSKGRTITYFVKRYGVPRPEITLFYEVIHTWVTHQWDLVGDFGMESQTGGSVTKTC